MVAPWRTSPVLLCLVAMGLAGGAGATLLSSPTHSLGTQVIIDAPYQLSNTVIAILFLLPFAVGFGAIVYRRLTSGRQPIPIGLLTIALAVLIVMGVLVVATHVLPSSSSLPAGKGTTNSTGGGGTGKTNGTRNSTGPHTTTPFVGLTVPSWMPFVAVSVVVLALVGLVLPATWAAVRRRADGPSSSADPVLAQSNARGALARAVAQLDAGADPRAVIERLYWQLLDRVSVVVGDLSGQTPEEIRGEKLVPLGVRPAAAIALTRLFEEARYSTHPMGPEAADRVRAAVSAAASDLARAPLPR